MYVEGMSKKDMYFTRVCTSTFITLCTLTVGIGLLPFHSNIIPTINVPELTPPSLWDCIMVACIMVSCACIMM